MKLDILLIDPLSRSWRELAIQMSLEVCPKEVGENCSVGWLVENFLWGRGPIEREAAACPDPSQDVESHLSWVARLALDFPGCGGHVHPGVA